MKMLDFHNITNLISQKHYSISDNPEISTFEFFRVNSTQLKIDG